MVTPKQVTLVHETLVHEARGAPQTVTQSRTNLASMTLLAYYAITVVFMVLDYAGGINLRLSFLDAYPGWRLAYYLLCYLCFGLIWWRPAWGAGIGVAESLLTLSLIILSTAIRVLIVSDEMIESGRGLVTCRELVNVGMAFLIVYAAYIRNLQSLRER